MESSAPASVITILVDHNIEGQAVLLWGTLAAAGWLDLIPLRLLHFADVGLAYDSNDRLVWRFAQAHHMYILTDNRNMEGQDSLEQTLRDEGTAHSVPVLTIGRINRITSQSYRELCATRLLEVVLYPEVYMGVGRVFVP